jgi:ribosomal subunit interface protein
LQIQIAGKNMSLGEALKERIAVELEAVVGKYFERQGEGHVTVWKDGHQIEVDCNIHLPSGIVLQSQGRGSDAHNALDIALEKLDKRVRRYKRRLRDHHARARSQPLPAEMAANFVIQAEADEEDGEADMASHANGHAGEKEASPLIIAETRTVITTMPVATAVMQLDLSENSALLFRNAANGRLNMVYRRSDGHVGWVDPGPGGAAGENRSGLVKGSTTSSV